MLEEKVKLLQEKIQVENRSQEFEVNELQTKKLLFNNVAVKSRIFKQLLKDHLLGSEDRLPHSKWMKYL